MEYFDRRASSYLAKSETSLLWKSVRCEEWRAIRSALTLRPGLSLLDMGCGAGYYSLQIRNIMNVEIYGVDESEAMMEAYRTQGFSGICSPIEAFVGDKKYDRILIAGVLEFVKNPEPVIAKAAGLLKEPGKIVCLIPNVGTIGVVYQWAHALQGCPTFIRDHEWYSVIARRHGLDLKGLARASCLSKTIVFQGRNMEIEDARG